MIEESKSVGIVLSLNESTNRLLTEATLNSKRTKRKEAALRLEDHLKRFECISQLGEVKTREPKQ